MAEGRAFSWDDMINNESTFTLVEEGDYDFKVIKVERGRHGGSAKLPACPKVTLTLAILDDSGNELTSLTHNIYMHSSVEGLISAFLLSVGLKKHGEPVRLTAFEKAPGRVGKCHVYKDKWTNDRGEEKENNKIKYFLDAAPAAQPSQTPYAPTAQPSQVSYTPTAQNAQASYAPPVQTAPQQTFGGWGNTQPGTGWTAR